MLITGQCLFAFVDPKDPYLLSEVAGEEQPGPILSLLASRPFQFLFLFHTPHTRANAAATRMEVERKHPRCHVHVRELPVSDPKDYSSLMGGIAREVRSIVRQSRNTENSVCVSSGTVEMRTAWFLLAAAGALPAKLLQVGSPAEPLFGAANVKEVRLDTVDWSNLRGLLMPAEYFRPPAAFRQARTTVSMDRSRALFEDRLSQVAAAPAPEPEAIPGLEEALQELGLFVGSASLRQAAESAAIAAPTDCPVLLQGETGTGKELFARLVHRMSDRREHPLVPVNCAAIPKELAESYLFGHVRGAFTGAVGDKRGKFEEAHLATLFLDEIGELTPEAQAKLLRVLQDGEVEPVGASRRRKVDVRIVAATNRNLTEEVAAGRFRADLYYRLEVLKIELPPLRARPAEISRLAMVLLRTINQRLRRERQLSPGALQRLEQHHWPGNVRELANVLERSVLYARDTVLGPDDLIITDTVPAGDPFANLPVPSPGFSLKEFLAQTRKQLIVRALEKSNGSHSGAAELLGISKQAVSQFLNGETVNED